MSKFEDIKDPSEIAAKPNYGMVYTCRCGWVDLGHANPVSKVATQGAQNLWLSIKGEAGERSANGLWFRVLTRMFMKSRVTGSAEWGVDNDVAVRAGLSTADKEAVALAVFMKTSVEFEAYQSSGLYPLVTDSGFSAEDLVSNLIGFYRVVRPATDWLAFCGPVSKAASQKIWRDYGGPGRGMYKIREARPILFPCGECADSPRGIYYTLLPPELREIVPAKLGTNFRMWNPDDPDQRDTPPTPTPTPTPAAPTPVVRAGRTIAMPTGASLSRLAGTEYGDVELWPIIWDANNPPIENPNRVKAGAPVFLPAKESLTDDLKRDAKRRSPTWRNYPH